MFFFGSTSRFTALKNRTLTKKFIRDTVRSIIDSNALYVPFAPPDVDKMNELLGTNYQGFVRKKNPVYPSDPRHLYWISDGASESFSWLNCITAITPEQRIKKAMRESVRPDTDEFKWGFDPQECVLCGASEHLQTDHVDPSFERIANEFMKLHKDIALVDGIGGVGEVFEDMNIEAEWIAFHAQRAVYQLLCRSCNASKGSRT